jgi:heme exporter protein B
MNMEPMAAILATSVLTLLAGTPAITFIGATGAALAVALPRGGLLVSVMVLPLRRFPILIFGVMARLWSRGHRSRRRSLQPFLILVCALDACFLPFWGHLQPAAALKGVSD